MAAHWELICDWTDWTDWTIQICSFLRSSSFAHSTESLRILKSVWTPAQMCFSLRNHCSILFDGNISRKTSQISTFSHLLFDFERFESHIDFCFDSCCINQGCIAQGRRCKRMSPSQKVLRITISWRFHAAQRGDLTAKVYISWYCFFALLHLIMKLSLNNSLLCEGRFAHTGTNTFFKNYRNHLK